MSDSLFSSVDLAAAGRPGFRLVRLEVLNWGTFDKRVWRLDARSDTLLLTGDIGSGKSTLVDAVSTLMLPSHRIAYNKAAGAARKERNLRSYVEGHHKTERNEATGSVRPVKLRGRDSYSVILGVFVNEGYDETVTLAQVFQQQDATGQPWRRFVTGSHEMSITEDFSGFGSDLNALVKRLRRDGASVETDFPPYGRAMRRLLGIRSEQAMELFHQTVSMKAVGDLNEFVRTHMLEPADARDRIEGIIRHFEDLTRSYDAVLRARAQLEALDPLVGTIGRYEQAAERQVSLREEKVATGPYFSEMRIRLRQGEIDQLGGRIEEARTSLDRIREQSQELAGIRDELLAAKAVAGGDRISELEREARYAREQMEERGDRRQRFDDAVQQAGLGAVDGPDGFAELTQQVSRRRAELDAEASEITTRNNALVLDHGEKKKELRTVQEDLDSLAGRRSNLPAEQLQLRSGLCAELGADEADLPFAGELLDVAEDYAQWRGAAERVLRGFALSLLVPQHRYADVAQWVNSRRLTARRSDGREVGARLVYERVPERHLPLQRPASDALLLADTVEIADTPLRGYLHKELFARADHVCADTLEEFRHADRAVTREGQVRSRDRHVKDDRRSAGDPRDWVLGWRNEQKIAALRERQVLLGREVDELADAIAAVADEQTVVVRRRTSLEKLGEYGSWKELDWEAARARAEAADAERARLLDGSSELAEIERRLADVDAQARDLTQRDRDLADTLSNYRTRVDHEESSIARDRERLAELGEEVCEAARGVYPRIEKRLGGEASTVADETHQVESRLSDALDHDLGRTQRELNGYTTSMLQAMGEIRRRWPEQATEMDESVEAREEYVRFHTRVADDDLPRFEAEFAEQLKTNAIRELAGFHHWLQRQADDIQEKLDKINEALGAIDFNPGRFVRLDRENTVNQDVRAFRADLRAITDDTLGGDDQYSEQRYQEVRAILERLRGREGHTDADRSWRERVTDVRNWFTFSASERDRETDEEWEHYQDSDGKSGGQKEKLAYTILAASLAYQFGLEWGVERARDFRFAVIDEAFGRGSDASTRYALELFAKLGLQLLIVTPLQKVHVIAPYVRSIGYVDNVEGRYSRLVMMTTEQYHSEHGRTP